MASVADLVEESELRRLAGPGTLAEGRELAKGGKVHIWDFTPLSVGATVQDEHNVELRSTNEGLTWSCSCDAGALSELCEHAVAVALETWRRAPPRRG
jgi:uncharacterized Zn finger protein